MLITVGVMLDTMRQIETHLLQRHYDGFLKKGRIKSRGIRRASHTGLAGATDMSNVGQLYIWLLVIFSIGIIAWVLQLSQNSLLYAYESSSPHFFLPSLRWGSTAVLG